MVDTIKSKYPASVGLNPRDTGEYGSSTSGNRIVSMDFNAGGGTGVEVIVPNNASQEELRVTKEYIKKVANFFDENGYKDLTGSNYQIRERVPGQKGYLTTDQNKAQRSDNKGGLSGYFHLEPFFKEDANAVRIINENKDKYAKILADTYGTLDGARIIPAHTTKQQGTTMTFNGQEISETQFGKSLVPELGKIMGSDLFKRSRFAKELENDPKLYEDLIALTYAEVGGDYKASVAFVETIFNRANAYGTDKLRNAIYPPDKPLSESYFEPFRTGVFNSKKNFLETDAAGPKYKETIKNAIKEALSGSNISNFATHNASAGTAAEAKRLDHVRATFNGELFYSKTNDNPEAREKHKGLIDKEIAWIKSVGGGIGHTGGGSGITPSSFRGSGTGSLLGEGGLLGGLFSSGGLFGTQGGLGALAGSLIGSGAIPTSSISSAISSSLPSALASLPSASTISSGLAESIQSGQGFTPFTSAVQSIASADTPVGRLSAIGDVATKYEAEIKALVPSLSGIDFKSAIPAIIDIENKTARDRILSVVEIANGTILDKPLSEIIKNIPDETVRTTVESYIQEDVKNMSIKDLVKDPSKIPQIPDFIDKVLPEGYKIGKIDNYIKELLSSENPQKQQEAIKGLKETALGGLIEEYSVETALTGSLEEITKTPLVSDFMDGKIGQILTGEESKVKSILTDLGASALTEATGISGDTSQTLLAGGTEEEIKKMRKEIGGIALDGFIESNPALKGIIDWFYNNQNLITLLGSAGAFAGLSSLLGGGIGGGFAAGAGGLLATRLLLGEEGFNQFQGIVQSAAAPVFNFAQKALIDSGLADVPIVGSLLKNILSMGSQNPLAVTALISGNVGMAAGLMAGTTGINVVNQGTTMADMMASLTGGDTTSQVQNNLAATGNAPVETMPPGSIDSDGKPGSTDANPSGGTQKGMYIPTSPVGYTDWGSTGMQSIVGGVN